MNNETQGLVNKEVMCKKILVAIIFFLLVAGCASMPVEQNQKPIRLSELEAQGFLITELQNIEDIEKESLKRTSDVNTSCPKKPFGCQNKAWNAFKSNFKDGDIMIHFSSPKEHWAALYGRAGYAIVREGIIVASMLTMVN